MLTVFTFNFGLGGYYQEKIHSVTRQALLFAASKGLVQESLENRTVKRDG